MDSDIVPKHTVEGCVVAPLEQLLKAVTQSISSCRWLCGARVLPRGFYETSYDPMLGAGTVRRLETRRVGQCARMSASNGGDKVAERRTAVAVGRAARLKQIRQSRRSESPSPAVLLVDDHVHLPGSVFCDAPMRHQQTDTCGEGRDAKRRQHTCLQNTRSRAHLPGCQVALLRR